MIELSESFFEEETRCGYTISAKMKKVWAVQLDLVKELLRVCDKHSLRIWVESGTLLGTIRHQGYIPWDDDIDMIMFREDYDTLLKIAPNEFKSPYFLQCAYTEKVPYPRGHAQLRMDGTTAILPNDVNQNFHQGIFIDIFVLDAIPDNEVFFAKKLKKANKYLSIAATYYKPIKATRIKTTVHRTLRKVYCLFYSFVDVYSKYENILRGETGTMQSERVANIGFWRFEKMVRSKSVKKVWYENTLFMPFEGLLVPVPAGYDQILTCQYGDYMTPRQVSSYHGGFLILDTDKSYLDYLLEIRKNGHN